MKKTFKDESEVIALIDKYRLQISDHLNVIFEQDHLADNLRETCEAYRIPAIKSDIETLHRQIEWREGRLESLKEILAEMRTIELPFKEENEHNATSQQVETL